jgi:hypothetical protein
LAVSPDHFDSLSVSDFPLRHGAVLAVDERENRVRQLCPCALVDTGQITFKYADVRAMRRWAGRISLSECLDVATGYSSQQQEF